MPRVPPLALAPSLLTLTQMPGLWLSFSVDVMLKIILDKLIHCNTVGVHDHRAKTMQILLGLFPGFIFGEIPCSGSKMKGGGYIRK